MRPNYLVSCLTVGLAMVCSALKAQTIDYLVSGVFPLSFPQNSFATPGASFSLSFSVPQYTDTEGTNNVYWDSNNDGTYVLGGVTEFQHATIETNQDQLVAPGVLTFSTSLGNGERFSLYTESWPDFFLSKIPFGDADVEAHVKLATFAPEIFYGGVGDFFFDPHFPLTICASQAPVPEPAGWVLFCLSTAPLLAWKMVRAKRRAADPVPSTQAQSSGAAWQWREIL